MGLAPAPAGARASRHCRVLRWPELGADTPTVRLGDGRQPGACVRSSGQVGCTQPGVAATAVAAGALVGRPSARLLWAAGDSTAAGGDTPSAVGANVMAAVGSASA